MAARKAAIKPRPPVQAEVIDLARAAAARAVGRLIELVEDKDPRIALSAAAALLDRAMGKAGTASTETPPDETAPQTPGVDALARLSAQDRADIRTILDRAARRSAGDPA